jgi:hypothetical protein
VRGVGEHDVSRLTVLYEIEQDTQTFGRLDVDDFLVGDL